MKEDTGLLPEGWLIKIFPNYHLSMLFACYKKLVDPGYRETKQDSSLLMVTFELAKISNSALWYEV